MAIEILRPCPGETDYAVAGGSICARVWYTSTTDQPQAMISPDGSFPSSLPTVQAVLDEESGAESNIWLFSSISAASTGDSPGAVNYLRVWGGDGSEAVSTFYGIPANCTEC